MLPWFDFAAAKSVATASMRVLRNSMWLLAAVVPVADERTSLAAEMISYPKSMNVITLETRPMAERGSIVNRNNSSIGVNSIDVGMLDTGKASQLLS